MNIEKIDHATLSQLVKAGAVHSVSAKGSAGGWGLTVKVGGDEVERSLALRGGKRHRIFRKMDTLATYLQGFGIYHFEVDSSAFDGGAVQMN